MSGEEEILHVLKKNATANKIIAIIIGTKFLIMTDFKELGFSLFAIVIESLKNISAPC